MSRDPIDAVLAYHQLSKHRLPNRYARSLGYLDWEHQPNPFRLYAGVERRPLAREGFEPGPTLAASYDPSRVPTAAVDPSGIARLLFDALALSAWKQAGGQRWSLRCNPSSGNLHPTEAYLITGAGVTGPGSGLGGVVWHYSPLVHALERRAELDAETWTTLIGDGEGLLIGLSTIVWREAWKYGERAFRYCQHDVGHAIAALAYAAGALGWHTRMLGGWDDAAIAGLLGLPDAHAPAPGPELEPEPDPERELADVLLFVGPRPPTGPLAPPPGLRLDHHGRPNRLSEAHQPWPVLAQVARASERRGPMTLAEPASPVRPEPLDPRDPPDPRALARHLFRTRRSAVDMDGVTPLARATWLAMLARTLPRPGQVPFASLLGRPRVHLLLFVHRVEGVTPGLYLLVRDPDRRAAITAAITHAFDWAPVASDGLELPLWRLEQADARQAAGLIACRQSIASDGAFCVAMLAELEPSLRQHGAWMYRNLHWEAGAIGQVLYLEAEAAGLRGTGIGCFFDDAIAELLGVGDRSLACLYQFTVGGPVDDPRLQTLDAYHHLDGPEVAG